MKTIYWKYGSLRSFRSVDERFWSLLFYESQEIIKLWVWSVLDISVTLFSFSQIYCGGSKKESVKFSIVIVSFGLIAIFSKSINEKSFTMDKQHVEQNLEWIQNYKRINDDYNENYDNDEKWRWWNVKQRERWWQ